MRGERKVFLILHQSKQQIRAWKEGIDQFLKEKLKLELHPDKSRIIPLSRGVDFVGFRNYYNYKLIRKRSIRKMERNINSFKKQKISSLKMCAIFQGWNAYAKWANTIKLRRKFAKEIYKIKLSTKSIKQ